VAKLDRLDRAGILALNNQAASYLKLTNVSEGLARDIYLVGLGRFLAYTDTAVEAAMRRAGA